MVCKKCFLFSIAVGGTACFLAAADLVSTMVYSALPVLSVTAAPVLFYIRTRLSCFLIDSNIVFLLRFASLYCLLRLRCLSD